jgi:hypothetical protein
MLVFKFEESGLQDVTSRGLADTYKLFKGTALLSYVGTVYKPI